jgi:hypothetical protein
MARIYKRTDRITVKIDDIIVKLGPLSLHQKTEVQVAMMKGAKNTDIREATRGLALAIQYSVKGIDGVVDGDGPYQLKFDNEILTEACVDDLMNMELASKLSLVCAGMINGVPNEFTDSKQNPLAGVEIVNPEKTDPEKKS